MGQRRGGVTACTLPLWTTGQSCEMGSLRGRGQTAEALSRESWWDRGVWFSQGRVPKPRLLGESLSGTKNKPPMSIQEKNLPISFPLSQPLELET